MNKSAEQTLNKEIREVIDVTTQMDLTDYLKKISPKNRRIYILILVPCGFFSKIYHIPVTRQTSTDKRNWNNWNNALSLIGEGLLSAFIYKDGSRDVQWREDSPCVGVARVALCVKVKNETNAKWEPCTRINLSVSWLCIVWQTASHSWWSQLTSLLWAWPPSHSPSNCEAN